MASVTIILEHETFITFFLLILIPFIFYKCIKINTTFYHTFFKLKISALVMKQIRVAGRCYNNVITLTMQCCSMCDLPFDLILLYFKIIFCNPDTSNAFLNLVNEKIKMKKRRRFFEFNNDIYIFKTLRWIAMFLCFFIFLQTPASIELPESLTIVSTLQREWIMFF